MRPLALKASTQTALPFSTHSGGVSSPFSVGVTYSFELLLKDATQTTATDIQLGLDTVRFLASHFLWHGYILLKRFTPIKSQWPKQMICFEKCILLSPVIFTLYMYEISTSVFKVCVIIVISLFVHYTYSDQGSATESSVNLKNITVNVKNIALFKKCYCLLSFIHFSIIYYICL